jgi:hypothetical protein
VWYFHTKRVVCFALTGKMKVRSVIVLKFGNAGEAMIAFDADA